MIEVIEKTDDFGNTIKIVYNFDENVCRVYDKNDNLGLEFNIIENIKKLIQHDTTLDKNDNMFYNFLKNFNGSYDDKYIDKNGVNMCMKYLIYLDNELTYFKNYIYYDGILYNYNFENVRNIIINASKSFDGFVIDYNRILDDVSFNVVYEHINNNIESVINERYIIHKNIENKMYIYDIQNKCDCLEVLNSEYFNIVKKYKIDDNYYIFIIKNADNGTILYNNKSNTLSNVIPHNINKDNFQKIEYDENKYFLLLQSYNDDKDIIILDDYSNVLYTDSCVETVECDILRNYLYGYFQIMFYNKPKLKIKFNDLEEESKRLKNLKTIYDDRSN